MKKRKNPEELLHSHILNIVPELCNADETLKSVLLRMTQDDIKQLLKQCLGID